MFDVIEHIPDPVSFLSIVANRTRFALLKTPLETGGDLFGAKSPLKQGFEHEDGHVNFFTPKNYFNVLDKSGLKIINGKIINSIIPLGAEKILNPEYNTGIVGGAYSICRNVIPCYFVRKIFGGCDHIALVQSQKISI